MFATKRLFATMGAVVATMQMTACSTVNPGDGGMSPSLVRAAEVSGDAAAAAGQPDAAAGLYERAYRAQPSPGLAVRWGHALRASGAAQAAVIDLQEAAKRFPGDAGLLTELGRCAAAGGYGQEASSAFSRAEAAPGAGWDTFMASGAYEAVSGRLGPAGARFARAAAAARDDRERYAAKANIALLRAQGGDLYGAIADLTEIVSHPGVDGRAHADLALLQALAGNRDAAGRELRQAGLSQTEQARVGTWLDGPVPTPLPVSGHRAR